MERSKPLRPSTRRRRDSRWGENDVNLNLNVSSEVPLPPEYEKKFETLQSSRLDVERERAQAARLRRELEGLRQRKEVELIQVRRENASLREQIAELQSKVHIWDQTEWKQMREEVGAIRQIVASQSAQMTGYREAPRRSAAPATPQQTAIQGKEKEVIVGLYHEVEYLKSVYPIKGLLQSKLKELQDLESRHGQLPERHPERKIIRALMKERATEARDLQELQAAGEKRMNEVLEEINGAMGGEIG